MKLCSLGYMEGLYGKYPRIDKSLILQYHEGLIATTCCIGAEVPQMILKKGEEAARKAFKWWLDIFGEDYYVELQNHHMPEQQKVNEVLLRFAKEFNVKVIASNDSHYIDQRDSNAHDILLCINTAEKQSTPVVKEYDEENPKPRGTRFGFYNDQFYFKTQNEMRELFRNVPEALDNTLEIASKCDHLKLKQDILLPNFVIPAEFKTQDDYLRDLTFEGARARYKDITPEIEERLNFELGTIKTMGFAGYFLIVMDFIKAGRDMGVFIGPGRGSAAGSAVAYTIGITNIDPIKYDLLFERFLNPDRKSMPDIDTDFDDEGRQKVIDYVVDKYGKAQVAQIVTYGTMAAKMSIKDVARVLDLPLDRANILAKLVPDKPGTVLKRCITAPLDGAGSLREKEGLVSEDIENCKQLRDIYNGHTDEAKVLKEAVILEGSVRGTGIHASAIIIAPSALNEIVPVCVAKDSDLLVTQYEGSIIEDAGVIKMDFLGLKTLTIIKEALRLIKQNHGIAIDIDYIPLDDTKTYELYQRGDTNGTFQFESAGMQKYLRELQPDKFEDLIAMNALYRPGPIEYIPNFIARKHGRESVTYDLPVMEKYLADTYGICVSGDTLVFDAITGKRVRIDALEDKVNQFWVQGVNENLESTQGKVTHWVCNGEKDVVKVTLRNGSSVKLTTNHRVLTELGWVEVGELSAGDYIATPRKLEAAQPQLLNVRWEEIVSIEPAGRELVYDITVDDIHNFVGNNIILHNCVYQEQIMLLSQLLAGFGKGDADILRKAMGKKQIAVLDKMKGQFMEGATAKGHPEKKLEKIWTDWEAFASYAFNKSHATCYAFVAYQTAYLKAHYPAEYMAGVLTNNQGNIEKVTFFMEECKRMGLNVKGPDVNESEQKFTVNKRGDIRYALAAIKGVGEGVVDSIVEERQKSGGYDNIFDFVRRSNPKSLNKRVMESLVQAGAFDGFIEETDGQMHRATFFAPSDKYDSFMEHLVKYAQAHQGQSGSAATSLFGDMLGDISIPEPKMPKVEPWTLLDKLNRERDMTGIFLSGHPLDDFRAEIQSFTTCSLANIENAKGRPVKIAGFVTMAEHRISKTGNGWGKFSIQDYQGQLEIVLFNEDYQRHKFLFEQGAALFITGIYEQRRFNGEWGFKIQDVRQLAGIADSLTQGITLRLALERITPELVETLDRICTENVGSHTFKIMLLDAANRTSLGMVARDRKVNASSQLTTALDRLGLEYKLN